jgi:hypothetical protein
LNTVNTGQPQLGNFRSFRSGKENSERKLSHKSSPRQELPTSHRFPRCRSHFPSMAQTHGVSASSLATTLGTPVRQPRPRCRRRMPFSSASSKFGRCVTADLRSATAPSPRTGSSCQTALKLGRSLAFVFRRDALYCARYRSGPIVCSGADDQLGRHEMSHWPQAPAMDEQLARNLAAAEVARAANLKCSSVEDEVLPLASHAFSAALPR